MFDKSKLCCPTDSIVSSNISNLPLWGMINEIRAKLMLSYFFKRFFSQLTSFIKENFEIRFNITVSKANKAGLPS
jgi:hypothetical protein